VSGQREKGLKPIVVAKDLGTKRKCGSVNGKKRNTHNDKRSEGGV